MRVLFLGGPGNISESAVTYFVEKKTPVAVLKRSAGGLFGLEGKIRVFYGDRDREEVLTEAMNAFVPDVVVDCTCFTIAQAETVIRALRKSPCRRFVFVSTADVYGYPLRRLPMGESDPRNLPNGDYAAQKKEIEKRYGQAFARGEPSLTIIRPGYSLGKTFALSSFGRDRGAYLVTRIRQGRPVYSPGDGTTLIDAGAAYNTGRMLARICEEDSTAGEAYNCANDRAVTYDEYLQAFGEALGKPVHIVHIPTDFLFSLGRKEVEESLLPDLAQYHLYFSVEKFRKKFPDFQWTYSLADAVRDFVAYQESCGGLEGTEEPVFEDRVIGLWTKAMEELRQTVREKLAQTDRQEGREPDGKL
ncbi:MAG: NAD-dependent epimerase/dehydratase family protein [Eubacteriales bacterium]|nr:NAD-dependent epimerase/dehydratase family protein [Eubacteriales bacterium]